MELDWKNLPFGYVKTDANVRAYYKDGKWGALEESTSEHINLHMAATCLHYGQEVFEGIKAFRGKDGKVRIFRMRENALRMVESCKGLVMQYPSVELFEEAVTRTVKLNERFVPPYESGASLYIRPLLIGITAGVGVAPSKEFAFIVFVTPVGPYFKGGFKPTKIVICRDYDRAAPLGTGTFKCGGNYAAGAMSVEKAHAKGYAANLFLDPREKKYLDECGPAANFFAIRGNTYITPLSSSVLPSITNKSLMQVAKDLGMEVEHRPVLFDEIGTFDEVGQCGTAAVITPIGVIDDLDNQKSYRYTQDDKAGEISTRLYNKLRAIQYGDEPDTHGWVTVLD
jgi:branched-chain amino acid aminotransferase